MSTSQSSYNSAGAPSPRLESIETISAQLDLLVAHDPRLVAVRARVGLVSPRLNPPGFVGIARIVCGQLLSVASAHAIWTRFAAIKGALDPVGFLALEETTVRAAGFSASKYRTVRAIAEAMVGGTLDFEHLQTLPAEAATAYLIAHKGIGPWTAQVYLMFCAGHGDVFPAGDLALRKAVMEALDLPEMPTIAALANMARDWAPYRSAAALLFWRYYAVTRAREGVLG